MCICKSAFRFREIKTWLGHYHWDRTPGSSHLLVVLVIRRPKTPQVCSLTCSASLILKTWRTRGACRKPWSHGLISSMLLILLWLSFWHFSLYSEKLCGVWSNSPQSLCILCDQGTLLCNLGHCFSTLQIKETRYGSQALRYKRGTENAEIKTRKNKTMLMKSRDNLLAFRDHAHLFSWWKVFFFNCSENANKTSFKKLTVMENLNVTMISKGKEMVSVILILLERRKNCEQRKTAGNWSLGIPKPSLLSSQMNKV